MGTLEEFKAFADQNAIPVSVIPWKNLRILEVEEQEIDSYSIIVKLEFSEKGLTRFLIEELTFISNSNVPFDFLQNITGDAKGFALEGRSTLVYNSIHQTIDPQKRTPEIIFFKVGEVVRELIPFLNLAKAHYEEYKIQKEREEQVRQQQKERERAKRLEAFDDKNRTKPQAFSRNVSTAKVANEVIKKNESAGKGLEKIPKAVVVNEYNFADIFNQPKPADFYEYTAITSIKEQGFYQIDFLYFYDKVCKYNEETGNYLKFSIDLKAKTCKDFFDALFVFQSQFFRTINLYFSSKAQSKAKNRLKIKTNGQLSDEYESIDVSSYLDALN
ncbi:unnamed protein product [Blepharisma stoltei]|uniref:Uncharacterized protein n=1 Tax=Blepharisma stoltei TaxID=1481888 RepID=A0AAU9JSN3_9CILI|nr:unnamed protein product [Blepharisma stoltei]